MSEVHIEAGCLGVAQTDRLHSCTVSPYTLHSKLHRPIGSTVVQSYLTPCTVAQCTVAPRYLAQLVAQIERLHCCTVAPYTLHSKLHRPIGSTVAQLYLGTLHLAQFVAQTDRFHSCTVAHYTLHLAQLHRPIGSDLINESSGLAASLSEDPTLYMISKKGILDFLFFRSDQ